MIALLALFQGEIGTLRKIAQILRHRSNVIDDEIQFTVILRSVLSGQMMVPTFEHLSMSPTLSIFCLL